MADAEEIPGYYGVVVPDRRFHISPLCPALRTIRNWKQGELNRYTKETDAILMGHLKRCPICFSMYRFNIRVAGKTYEFLLDKYDISVLIGMSELHKNGTRIAIKDICAYGGMTFVEVNDTVKRLKKIGLVAPCEWVRGTQVRGHRKFTTLGVAVVLAHSNKLYSAPSMDVEEDEKANQRIF